MQSYCTERTVPLAEIPLGDAATFIQSAVDIQERLAIAKVMEAEQKSLWVSQSTSLIERRDPEGLSDGVTIRVITLISQEPGAGDWKEVPYG